MGIYYWMLFVVFLSNGIVNIKEKYIKNFAIILSLFLFWIVAGGAYHFHDDDYLYRLFYNNFTIKNISNSSWEWGYKLSNVLVNNHINYSEFKLLYYLIFTLLVYSGTSKLFNKKNRIFIISLMFLFNQFYRLIIPSVRQVMAVGIFIYSISYLYKRDRKYIALVGLATMFHSSAVFLLINLIIHKIKINWKSMLTFGVVLKLILLLNNHILRVVFIILNKVPILNRFLNNYDVLSFKNSLVPISLTNDVPFILVTLILMKYRKKVLRKPLNVFLIRGYILYYTVSSLVYVVPMMFRIKLYYYIFFIMLIVKLPGIVMSNRKEKAIIKFLIILSFSYLSFYRSISMEKKWHPYTNYLQTFYKDIDYRTTVEYREIKEREFEARKKMFIKSLK